MERKAFTVLSLREQPQLLKVAAQWFHSKWQIPCQAYEDSMQAVSYTHLDVYKRQSYHLFKCII